MCSRPRAIREQLVRILNSDPFHQAQRRQRFLEYIVNEALAGRGERLKGYNIAQAVFDRAETFDPNIDPIVRMEAARLRDRLREYYDGDGQSDPIRISLPKGTYTPHIEFGLAPTLNPRPDRAAPIKQLGMLAAAVLLIIAAGLWGLQYWTSGPSLPDKPSVAVLPFDNIGADPKWDRLADGMTDDVITDLSHSKDLVVIARNSTELYKGKPIDLRQVGRDLNVKYVLQGSIQSMGDQIRVNAQLIEVASGGHVWSERTTGLRTTCSWCRTMSRKKSPPLSPARGGGGGLLRKPSVGFSSASRPRAYLPSKPTCWALRLKPE